nr:hypothetical protein [Tanacetum cinerariifolium]
MHRHLRSPPSPPPLRRFTPHPTVNATAAITTATAAAFPAAAVTGCGRYVEKGAVRRGTTIVVAVGRRYTTTAAPCGVGL